MNRIRSLWLTLLGSLWFVPALVVTGCIALALLLIEAQGSSSIDLAQRWPRVFGAGTDGARSMLSAIATSMVTVAGVVFSVTIVALSLASSQYSPRVLGNFMDDRPTQLVLGAFVGIFAYCLVVLRTVRNGDGGAAFMPAEAVFGGVVLALVGVAMLIYFIHHVASSIQASSIVERIAGDTVRAIDHLFPQPLGRTANADEARRPDFAPPGWALPAPRSGYITAVDDDGLMAFAAQHRRVVHLEHVIGDFVVEGLPLVRVSGAARLDDDAAKALGDLFSLARQRTVHQDAPYGLQQLVDLAVKALSPGINDPTTAVMCIDRLGALLVRLAGRDLPGPYRSDGEAVRVVAKGPDFDDMAALALDEIVAHSRGDRAVLARLLDVIESVSGATHDARHHKSLQRRLELIVQAIERDVSLPQQHDTLFARAHAIALRMEMASARGA